MDDKEQAEPVAWYWEHVMQQSHGVIESGFSGTRVQVTDDAMWNGQVATVVTELHAGRRLLPPKFAESVGQPTEIPAASSSHREAEVKALREAAQFALNVLFLLSPEVKALGAQSSRVFERLHDAIHFKE